MEKKNKSAISPHIFAFLIRKMKHESFKSHLNQHKEQQQKQYIISAHFQSLKSNIA